MDKDVKKDHTEPSKNPPESVGGSPRTKDDKAVEASNNKDGTVAYPESTQIGAVIAVQDCPVQPTHEPMDVDPDNIPMEPSEIVIEQDNLEETSSQPGDKIEDTISKDKSISKNDNVELRTTIKVEVIDITEPSQTATTSQNISKSLITGQAQELTDVIQCKEESVPIQYTKRPIPQEAQIKPEKNTENLPYNTNVHSSSNVVPIYDNNECTPGKRARLEPSCSAEVVKTENAAEPKNEPGNLMITKSQRSFLGIPSHGETVMVPFAIYKCQFIFSATNSDNDSNDVIEILSPTPSDAKVETASGPGMKTNCLLKQVHRCMHVDSLFCSGTQSWSVMRGEYIEVPWYVLIV